MQIDISVEELRTLLERGDPISILDVRADEDLDGWAIPGSQHADVYASLSAGDPNALAEVDLPASLPVVTVCAKGRTSLIAAEQLRGRGYQARSLLGGLKAWSLAWNTAEIALPIANANVVQVRRTGKGCLSHLIGSSGEAVVIDASVDPEIYLNLASERGWTVKYVLETHVHADHISRARLLAEQSGAQLRLPVTNRVDFSFTPIRDGEVVEFGQTRLLAMHTPGHTLESTIYQLANSALFTGDTLFLAGVGRPDLEASAEEARDRAHLLWHSLRNLAELNPELLVLPGHTDSPVEFDGTAITAKLCDVVESIPTLRLGDDEFVTTILSRLPETPPNHATIVAINESGLPHEGDPTDLEAGANRCAVA